MQIKKNVKKNVNNDSLSELIDHAMNRSKRIESIDINKTRGANWRIIILMNNGDRHDYSARTHRDVINKVINDIANRNI